ncbi:MAG: SRPBCC family protein [Rhodanobacteraceae bacterium]|nr:MAG: SRPBCC family protein [Rhodanobacteraceae bacterium]
MTETATLHGHIRRLEDGSAEGKLQRSYEGHDRVAVWRMLTDPASLAQWIAPGTIEPRKGGKAHIDFQDSGIVIDSAVLEYDAPRLLAYSWSSGNQPLRPLRWELADVAGGTRLTLTVRTPAGEDPAKACAGFEGHLEMLAAALEGVPIKFPFDLFLAARKAYNEQLGK